MFKQWSDRYFSTSSLMITRCLLACVLLISSAAVAPPPIPVSEAERAAVLRVNIDAFLAKCTDCLGEPIQAIRQTVKNQKNSRTLRDEDAYVLNERVALWFDSLTAAVIGYEVCNVNASDSPVAPDNTPRVLTEDQAFDAAKPFLKAFDLPLDKTAYMLDKRNDSSDVIAFWRFVTYKDTRVWGLSSRIEISMRTGKVQKASNAVLFDPPAEPAKMISPCDAVSKADAWLRENTANIHASSAKISVEDCNDVQKVIARPDRLSRLKFGGVAGRFEYCWEVPCEYSKAASMFTNAYTWKGEIRVSCTSGEILDFG